MGNDERAAAGKRCSAIILGAEAMLSQFSRLESELDAAKMDNNKHVIELHLARDARDTFRRGMEARQKDLAEAGKDLDEKDATIRRLRASVERLNASNLQMLQNPVFVINENSDKQRQLREKADAWVAVHDQLCAPETDLRNLNIPASCGRNIAVGKIRELQRKAAAFDNIIAVSRV